MIKDIFTKKMSLTFNTWKLLVFLGILFYSMYFSKCSPINNYGLVTLQQNIAAADPLTKIEVNTAKSLRNFYLMKDTTIKYLIRSRSTTTEPYPYIDDTTKAISFSLYSFLKEVQSLTSTKKLNCKGLEEIKDFKFHVQLANYGDSTSISGHDVKKYQNTVILRIERDTVSFGILESTNYYNLGDLCPPNDPENTK